MVWSHILHATYRNPDRVKYYARAYSPSDVAVGPHRDTKEEASQDLPGVIARIVA
jgi:hypothetical protein